MSYFVRAFYTAPEVPPVAAFIDWVAAEEGITLRIGDGAGVPPMDPTSPDWWDAEPLYKEGRLPIPCSIERDDGSPDGLFTEEVGAFFALLEGAGDIPERSRVAASVRANQFLVTAQLLSDLDAEGHAASEAIIEFLVRDRGGLAQADGGGFYEGDECIVEVG